MARNVCFLARSIVETEHITISLQQAQTACVLSHACHTTAVQHTIVFQLPLSAASPTRGRVYGGHYLASIDMRVHIERPAHRTPRRGLDHGRDVCDRDVRHGTAPVAPKRVVGRQYSIGCGHTWISYHQHVLYCHCEGHVSKQRTIDTQRAPATWP